MAQKSAALSYCKDYLTTLDLGQYFSIELFNQYYFLHIYENAYQLGINAADYILFNTRP